MSNATVTLTSLLLHTCTVSANTTLLSHMLSLTGHCIRHKIIIRHNALPTSDQKLLNQIKERATERAIAKREQQGSLAKREQQRAMAKREKQRATAKWRRKEMGTSSSLSSLLIAEVNEGICTCALRQPERKL